MTQHRHGRHRGGGGAGGGGGVASRLTTAMEKSSFTFCNKISDNCSCLVEPYFT